MNIQKIIGISNTANMEVDGVATNVAPENFKEIVFKKTARNNDIVKVIFADYIIKPPEGFDLHEKWNNGIAPPSRSMYGVITSETSGMYKFSLKDEDCVEAWAGWCPKKSCTIITL